jgi:hypothetical protein
MTTSAVTNPNGSARKTLASQLDRLDDILTGLSEALNESVSTAVEKAVAGVLTEILTNPSFAERLRGPVILPLADNAMTDSPLPSPRPRPALLSKVMRTVRAGWTSVRLAARAVLRRGATMAKSARAYVTGMFSRSRVVALTATALTGGLVAYCAGPRLLPLLTAAASRLRILGVRLPSLWRRAGTACVAVTR